MKKIYASTPFRLANKINEICDFIQVQGHFPIHPFNALPLNRYSYDNFNRDDIMDVCYGLVDLSDELWIFGIGSGSLDEIKYAKFLQKPVESYIKQFDSDWEKYSKKYKINYIVTTTKI